MNYDKEKKVRVERLLFPTYLSVIRNSENAQLFRSFYAKVDGKTTDVMRDGELSCAFYVSSILKMFDLLKRIHGTVASTIKDLEESGWTRIEAPQEGSVLLWEEKVFPNNEKHAHIGFYLGEEKAISNSEIHKVPKVHHWTFEEDTSGQPERKITAIYWRNDI